MFIFSCDDDSSPTTPSPILGCMDDTACNYDALADEDDGTCAYAEENFDCNSNCIAEIDCAGICGGEAFVDDCYACVGGTTGFEENYGLDSCGVCFGQGVITVTIEECESEIDCGWETTTGPNKYCSSSSCNSGISCTFSYECMHQGGFAYAGCDASSYCQYEQIVDWVCDDIEICEDVTYTECP